MHSRPKRVGMKLYIVIAVQLGMLMMSSALFAQSGLRESLERLDRNEDGEISPDEITPLARPYL